jgi:hypothetical protein
MKSTEITQKIMDHRSGKITDEQLIKYLTEDVRYKPSLSNPHEPNSGDWWGWAEDADKYVPGSFAEVELARDRGLLDRDVYEKVLAVFYRADEREPG